MNAKPLKHKINIMSIDLVKTRKIYMIGIKGVGMTMLAQYLNFQDIEVYGSDTPEVFMTDAVLKKNKIRVIEEFSENNLDSDVNLVIHSTAYNKENNFELKKILSGKVKVLSYPEALSGIFNQMHGIAVTGSHGKTTTTAWLGFVLEGAEKSPSVLVGSNVPQFDGLSISGKSDYMVVELDEYQNKLKYYFPKIALLNNIDYDHPDFFSNKEDYIAVFVEFIKKISTKGFLVANFDDPIIRKLAYVNSKCKVISYGIDESADYVAYDIEKDGDNQLFRVKMGIDFDDEESNSKLGEFSITLSGKHNIYNALAVIATSIEMGVDLFTIRKYLSEFKGTSRRMEELGVFRGARIIDDYAHHPTEIKTTIEGARSKFSGAKLRIIFHPHTFTRTKAFLDEFADSFHLADEVIVVDIYGSAREEQGGVHSLDLVRKINKNSDYEKAKHIGSLEDCEEYLRKSISRGEVIILMGAGDIFRIGQNLLK